MLRLGLTGGIGAGKSTVASTLSELGAVVVDADTISREVVAPGTEGLADIVTAFGADVLDADGALDRPALAQVVFADDEARSRLNAIVHPRVGQRTAEIVADAPDDAVVVHDVPLLVENGMGAAFALVVVVDAPVDVRVQRLQDTRGMSEEEARSRMAAQADDDARRAAADVWLDNGGDQDRVRDRVTRLWHDRIVPFEANTRAGRAVDPDETVVAADPDWTAQGRRLAARLAVAGATGVDRVEHVGPTAVPGLPAPDVLDLLVLTAEGRGAASPEEVSAALAGAGHPRLGPHRHGAADPVRPVRLQLRPASSDDARAVLGACDAARADPERIRADPAAVRAEVDPGAILAVAGDDAVSRRRRGWARRGR